MRSKTQPGRCNKRGAPAQGVRVWELVRRVLFGGVERSPGAPGSKAALRTPGNALQGAAAVSAQREGRPTPHFSPPAVPWTQRQPSGTGPTPWW
jgi:hypothetical protein